MNHEGIKKMASAYLNNERNIGEFEWDEVFQFASLQLERTIQTEVHMSTLRLLAYDYDPSRYTNAAKQTANESDLHALGEEALVEKIAAAELATAELDAMPIKEVQTLCQRQSLYTDLQFLEFSLV